jgi:hypothetical protein
MNEENLTFEELLEKMKMKKTTSFATVFQFPLNFVLTVILQ